MLRHRGAPCVLRWEGFGIHFADGSRAPYGRTERGDGSSHLCAIRLRHVQINITQAHKSRYAARFCGFLRGADTANHTDTTRRRPWRSSKSLRASEAVGGVNGAPGGGDEDDEEPASARPRAKRGGEARGRDTTPLATTLSRPGEIRNRDGTRRSALAAIAHELRSPSTLRETHH